jgi:RsiW-degrading membrane proteinase PrsW (M82 family)
MFIGGLLAIQSYRLLITSGPDRPHTPGEPERARTFLIVAWLIGSIIGAVQGIGSVGEVMRAFIIGTTIALSLMGIGALWLYRWSAAKFDSRWLAEHSKSIRAQPPEWSVFYAFVWGIVSAFLAFALEVLVSIAAGSQYVQLILPVSTTSPGDVLGDPTFIVGVIVLFVIVVPLIEEALKALSLRLFRNVIHSHGDGLLIGLVAGLGFGFVESTGYTLGSVGGIGIFVAVWARVATMMMHGLTTSLVGAGYARARLANEPQAIGRSFARAVVIHGAWNTIAVASTVLVLSGQACLGLVVVIALIALGVRLMPRTVAAAVDRSIQDDHKLAGVDLPSGWSPTDDGVWWRLAGGQPQFAPSPFSGVGGKSSENRPS